MILTIAFNIHFCCKKLSLVETYTLRLTRACFQSVFFTPLNHAAAVLSKCICDALDAIRQIDRPVREPENYAASISRDVVLATIILHDSQWNLKSKRIVFFSGGNLRVIFRCIPGSQHACVTLRYFRKINHVFD